MLNVLVPEFLKRFHSQYIKKKKQPKNQYIVQRFLLLPETPFEKSPWQKKKMIYCRIWKFKKNNSFCRLRMDTVWLIFWSTRRNMIYFYCFLYSPSSTRTTKSTNFEVWHVFFVRETLTSRVSVYGYLFWIWTHAFKITFVINQRLGIFILYDFPYPNDIFCWRIKT